jgi:tRNA-splicing ligase RtcB
MQKRALEKIHDHLWEIPRSYRADMRVPARVYASEAMLDSILGDRSLEQLVNVACLPGIRKYAIAMPDVHEGYGFPIGGVAAIDAKNGVISPGGIGYDINCGVRLLRSRKMFREIEPLLATLAHSIAREVPSGVGRGGSVKLKGDDLDRVLRDGARCAVEMGFGEEDDLRHIESGGRLDGADPKAVSESARGRGHDQLGTIGSGNHFVEIDRVDVVYDEEEAARLGITKDGIVLQIHTGSRGLGHQVATDSLRVMAKTMARYNITVPDRELACAPFRSPEGRAYFGAMTAAANTAFANRQLITHRVREVFARVFDRDPRALGLDLVYDVSHNMAKVERHMLDGRALDVIVHRKGATRAFGPGAPDLPDAYRDVGQPVIIGGSMETGSAVLVGTARAMAETWGSTAHGAGRTMSRAEAKRRVQGGALIADMASRGIVVRAASRAGVAEEAGVAYKDLDAVVGALHALDISRRVVSLTPIGCVKG